MPDTRRGEIADIYTNEICQRIEAVQSRITSGELTDEEMAAAKGTLEDLNKFLEKRKKELEHEKKNAVMPKKFLGFI